jgi:WD40 repeat protein
VVAYQMLSGWLPFEAETPSGMIYGHAYLTPRPLSSDAPDVPRSLAALVDRLLAKEPADRYQSCEEVREDLRRVRDQAATTTEGLRKRTNQRWPSWGVRAAMTALALLGLANLAAVLWHRTPRQDTEPDTRGAAGAAQQRPELVDPPVIRLELPKENVLPASIVQPGGSVVDPGGVPPPQPPRPQGPVVGRMLRRFDGHKGGVFSLAVSPDGRRFLAGDRENTVRLWDVDSGVELARLRVETPAGGSAPEILCLAFAPDGRRAAGGGLGWLRLWELDTFTQLQAFQGHTARVTSVAFSPDGARLLSASSDPVGGLDNTARLWDVRTGQELKCFNSQRVGMAQALFTRDGRQALVSVSGGVERAVHQVRVWDLETGKVVPRYEGEGDAAGFGSGLVLSADGRRALTRGINCLYLWESETGRILRRIPTPSYAAGLALTPDGLHAAVCGGDDARQAIVVYLYELERARAVCRCEGHSTWVQQVVVLPDSHYLLSGSMDGAVFLWELPVLPRLVPFGKGEVCRFQGHTATVTSVACASDGRRVLSGSADKTIRLWDLPSGKEAQRFDGHGRGVRSVAFTPGGHYAVSGGDDHTVRVWKVATGEELRRFHHPAPVLSVACSPDGRSVLTGAMDQILRLWDLDSGREVQGFYGHRAPVDCVSFFPDGRRALSIGRDKVRFWDVATGQQRHNVSFFDVANLVFAPSGPYFLVEKNRSSGRKVLTLDELPPAKNTYLEGGGVPFPNHDPMWRQVLSPDHRFLAHAAGINLELSNLQGRGRQEFKGHSGNVTSVVFSPDGLCVVSGSTDGTVRVWGLGE